MAADGFTLQGNALRIENDGGTWDGVGKGLVVGGEEEGQDERLVLFMLVGHGGYEGFLMEVVFTLDEQLWGLSTRLRRVCPIRSCQPSSHLDPLLVGGDDQTTYGWRLLHELTDQTTCTITGW